MAKFIEVTDEIGGGISMKTLVNIDQITFIQEPCPGYPETKIYTADTRAVQANISYDDLKRIVLKASKETK